MIDKKIKTDCEAADLKLKLIVTQNDEIVKEKGYASKNQSA